MLLTERLCPSDIELKKWACAVKPTPPKASAAANKVLASEHMALGKGKWSVKSSKKG